MTNQTPIQIDAGQLALYRKVLSAPINHAHAPLYSVAAHLLGAYDAVTAERDQLRRQLDAAEATAPADVEADATQTTWTAPDGTTYDLKAVLTDRFEQAWSCEGWLRRIGSGELFPLMVADFGDHMEFMSLRDAIACYGPLTAAEPGPLESAVAEAFADIANDDQAEPEPVPPAPPWLIPAGDD